MNFEVITIPQEVIEKTARDLGYANAEAMQVDLNKEKELHWCKCGASKGSYYVEDNMHRDVDKHHYRCRKCHKITQIG